MDSFASAEPLAIHQLFANYLAKKIEEGRFPKGSALPSVAEFMMVFKLANSDVVKAILDLEERRAVRILGNAKAEVVADGAKGVTPGLDVRKDVSALFERCEELELKALENAWQRIDREAIRRLFIKNRDATPSDRIWMMNREMQAQILGHCGDMELCRKIELVNGQLEFFRRLHLAVIPQNEILAHALAIEAIARSFIAFDLEDARFHVSSYIGQMQERLLDVFKERHLLGGAGASKAERQV